MRLIDADNFKGKVISRRTYCGVDRLVEIDSVPTAYDVDKVVHELRKASCSARPVGWCREKEIVELKTAIDIVKKGGMSGKNEFKTKEFEWIPVKFHEITEEERAFFSEGISYICDSLIPEDNEEILVTDGTRVWSDINYIDDEMVLDSGYEWKEITAWAPLPKPYKEDEKTER